MERRHGFVLLALLVVAASGCAPKVDLEAGLRQTLDYFRTKSVGA